MCVFNNFMRPKASDHQHRAPGIFGCFGCSCTQFNWMPSSERSPAWFSMMLSLITMVQNLAFHPPGSAARPPSSGSSHVHLQPGCLPQGPRCPTSVCAMQDESKVLDNASKVNHIVSRHPFVYLLKGSERGSYCLKWCFKKMPHIWTRSTFAGVHWDDALV